MKTPKAVREWFRQNGRKGGKVGGPARAKSLTKERRQEIAKLAAVARWKGKRHAD